MMRVIVPHQKNPEEISRLVESTASRLAASTLPPMVSIERLSRRWSGPVMDFSFVAQAAFFSIPVEGRVTVEEKQVIVDCLLPALLTKLLSEEKLQARMESRVRGILSS